MNPEALFKVSNGSLEYASSLFKSGPASIIRTFIPCSANVRAAIPPVAPVPTIIASYGFKSKISLKFFINTI